MKYLISFLLINKMILNMKKLILTNFILLFISLFFNYCSMENETGNKKSIRGLVDTVGFAHLDWQMDSVMQRIDRLNKADLKRTEQPEGTVWKAAICPHDDYKYAGWLYEAVLRNIKAKTIILFGVAHKARKFNLENQIIFDSFDLWSGPYGPVKVSALRDSIINELPNNIYVVHDSMETLEHSVEAIIPFLQYQNRNLEIISILVPYMSYDRMNFISENLVEVISKIINKNNLTLGKDIALISSSDAVHYGDEEWGGKNYAPYGTDSSGNAQAVSHELEIINKCFNGEMTPEKIAEFYSYTVNPDDFREYKWTWCGRYSIPFGLLTAIKLQSLLDENKLIGVPIAYATSIAQKHLKVEDLRMGQTAVATPHHWVGYPAIGFK